MAKITYENLLEALSKNNEHMKDFVYDVITNFSPTAINVAKILSHLCNTSIHVTAEDKQLWDSSYRRAVEYADETFSKMTSIELLIVDELPTENISKSTIYLLRNNKTRAAQEDVYEQFIYSKGEWVSLGMTSVDLNQFYNRDEIDSMINELKQTTSHIHGNLAILNAITAAFTIDDKEYLKHLKSLDMDRMYFHVDNDEIHLTEQDREAINAAAKINPTDIEAHMTNTGIHLSTEQVTEWNGMLDKAKEYTDESIENFCILKSVDALPDVPNSQTIYMIKSNTPTTNNVFDKYVYLNGYWEKLGGGGALPDMSLYCLYSDMVQYVNEHTHSHDNMAILSASTAPFTTELLTSIQQLLDNKQLTENHMSNWSIHVTPEQEDTLNNLSSIISEKVEADMKKFSGLNLRKIIVDSLPTNFADVDTGAIYFVRRPGCGSSTRMDDMSDEEKAATSIINAEKKVNYDKYIWSSDNECWEIMSPGSMVLTDDDITSILDF